MYDSELYKKIKKKFALGPASHFVHRENLSGIFRNGLLCHSMMRNQVYRDISDPSVQLGREQKIIPPTKRSLHDYVPLYFGPKTPLAIKYQNFNDEFLYLRFSLNILQTAGAVFTDGNARSNVTQFFLFNNLNDLSAVDPIAINASSWVGDDEKKRRKQSEILIPDSIPVDQIYDIFCSSERTRQYVLDRQNETGLSLPVYLSSNWFFKPKVQKW